MGIVDVERYADKSIKFNLYSVKLSLDGKSDNKQWGSPPADEAQIKGKATEVVADGANGSRSQSGKTLSQPKGHRQRNTPYLPAFLAPKWSDCQLSFPGGNGYEIGIDAEWRRP